MGPPQELPGICVEGVCPPSPRALPVVHGVGDGCGCPHPRAAGPGARPLWPPSPAAACSASRRSMAPSGRWHEAALDANTQREAPADSTITQGSPSLLLNGRHFSVSFPLPLELKPPFCSKTRQAKEILLPFQLTNSPPSCASRSTHPTGYPFPGVCRIAGGGQMVSIPCPPTGTTSLGCADSGLCLGHSSSFPRLRRAAILFCRRARHPITLRAWQRGHSPFPRAGDGCQHP